MLQTVELRGRINTWEALHKAVCERFDRDQYQHHLCQLDTLRQTGSVADYHAKFEQFVHSILLYNDSYDDVYLVTRFLGGLKEDIRAPIALHRPKDVDIASALALLQEEELEFRKHQLGGRSDNKEQSRPSSKVFTALDRNKTYHKKDDSKKSDQSGTDSKMAALLAHRKANGLCFTCGEKWTGKAHKCPEQIPLHVVQELVGSIQSETTSVSEDSDSDTEYPEDCVLSLPIMPSQSEQVPPKRRKTMRFRGLVDKQEILILLDSGSACTFISQDLASHFHQQLQPCEPLHFATSDGTPMLSDTCIPQFTWHIQGQSFVYNVRVLPLKCFDMIIGADWLEDHSPTWIHWKKKRMSFPVQGKRIFLTGITDDLTSCKKISLPKLKGLLRRKAILHAVELHRSGPSASSAPIHSIQETAPSVMDQDNVPTQVQQLLQ